MARSTAPGTYVGLFEENDMYEEELTYCVEEGKYSLQIRCCPDGLSWAEAMNELIYLTKGEK